MNNSDFQRKQGLLGVILIVGLFSSATLLAQHSHEATLENQQWNTTFNDESNRLIRAAQARADQLRNQATQLSNQGSAYNMSQEIQGDNANTAQQGIDLISQTASQAGIPVPEFIKLPEGMAMLREMEKERETQNRYRALFTDTGLTSIESIPDPTPGSPPGTTVIQGTSRTGEPEVVTDGGEPIRLTPMQRYAALSIIGAGSGNLSFKDVKDIMNGAGEGEVRAAFASLPGTPEGDQAFVNQQQGASQFSDPDIQANEQALRNLAAEQGFTLARDEAKYANEQAQLTITGKNERELQALTSKSVINEGGADSGNRINEDNNTARLLEHATEANRVRANAIEKHLSEADNRELERQYSISNAAGTAYLDALERRAATVSIEESTK